MKKLTTNDLGQVFCDFAQCHVLSLKYEPALRLGTLIIADGEATDMMGVIRVFKQIDKDVVQITVAEKDGRILCFYRKAVKWIIDDRRGNENLSWWKSATDGASPVELM